MEEKPGTLSWILNNMPLVAIMEGGFLVLFGIITYVYSGQSSFTALIPSIFGVGTEIGSVFCVVVGADPLVLI